jgi:hypothetical protein
MNIGKHGVSSFTFGTRGCHYTVGRKSRRVTVGLPGTGIFVSGVQQNAPDHRRSKAMTHDLVAVLGKAHAVVVNEVVIADEAGDQASVAQLSQQAGEIEEAVAKMVPSSIAGILVQAKILRDLCALDLERVECTRQLHDSLVENIAAGLERLCEAERRP